MISTRTSVEIARSSEDVFNYIAKLENYPLWQSGMISVSYEPPVKKGTIARGRSSNFGIEVDVEVEITDFEPPKRMDVTSRLGPLRFFLRFLIEATGEKSCGLTWINEIDTGTTYTLAESVMQDLGQVKIDSDLRNLKILLEKEA